MCFISDVKFIHFVSEDRNVATHSQGMSIRRPVAGTIIFVWRATRTELISLSG